MRRKILSFLLLFALILSLPSLSSYADLEAQWDNEQDDTGGTTTGTTDTETDSSTSNSSSSSSGSSSTTLTAEQMAYNEVSDARSDVLDILKGYRSSIKSSDTYLSYATGDLSSLLAAGYIQIPSSSIRSLLSTVDAFNDLLNKYSEYGSVQDLIYDTDDLNSLSTSVDGEWDGLSSDDKEAIADAVSDELGLTSAGSYALQVIVSDLLASDVNTVTLTNYSPILVAFGLSGALFLCESTDNTNFLSDIGNVSGIRTDLINGGLNAYAAETDDGTVLDWLSRFTCGLSRFQSNAMEDYCDIAYMQDIQISSVSQSDINIISYNDTTRYWYIYDEDGELDQIVEADDSQETISTTFEEEGTYTAIEYRNATYTKIYYVEYEYMDYLYDMETLNILYFNHTTISNDSNMNVLVESVETYTGLEPTGESAYLNVNEFGEITTDDSIVERVE